MVPLGQRCTMASRKPSRRNRFRTNDEPSSQPELSPEVEQYAEDFEPNPWLKRSVKWIVIAMIGLIGWIYYSQRDAIAEVRAQAAERDRQEIERERREIEIGRQNSLAFESARDEALKNLSEEKYFEAVFSFRQALSYDGHNLSLRENLLTALEKSCDEGNEMHCRSIDREKKIIASLKEQPPEGN